MFRQGHKSAFGAALLLLSFATTIIAAEAAEELRLRDGISYYQDTDNGFPILATKIEDVEPEHGRPTFIFFGASGDLNTNRQAKRVVDLYKHFKSTSLKFVVIDVDHATAEPSKQILKKYYQGYIPGQVLLDKEGQKIWSANGEIDSKILVDKIQPLL